MGPPPKKSRTGLIATLIILAILVVGGGGVGAYLLLSREDDPKPGGNGDTADSARAAADTYVKEMETALNTERVQDVDVSPLEPVACGEDYTRMRDEVEDARDFDEDATTSQEDRPRIEVSIEDFKADDESGSFTMTQIADGDEGPTREMTVAKENGDWKVCGLYEDQEPSTRPSVEPSEDSTDEPDDEDSSRPVPNPIPTT
ncbi:MAG TPA: hypothetical protein VNP92_34565 [Actinophytocola sp.]|nr:hypothetical protein [Actinophytocola sp.]